jgi:hypothetical protein
MARQVKPMARGPRAAADGPPPTARARRDRRLAWVSVALIVPAIVLATFLAGGILALQGYTGDPGESVPIGPTLLAAVPAMLVVLLTAGAAVWFGVRARRGGATGGWIPALIGGAVGGWFLLANLLALVIA